MKRLSVLGLAAALLAVLGGAVQANQTITVDAPGWMEFSWDNGPNVWNNEGAFTYTSMSWTSLKVVDLYFDGDQFEVYDSGVLLGATSVPVDDGKWIGDADSAFVDALWSSGEFFLAPGDHAITLYIINKYPSGVGALRADSYGAPTIPAPGAILLGSFGAGLVNWLRRRKLV